MKKLIELAKEKGFISERISFLLTLLKNGEKRQIEYWYYIWMCELQKWLRDKHQIEIEIHFNELTSKYRIGYISAILDEKLDIIKEFKIYEQALEKSLIESLKLIK